MLAQKILALKFTEILQVFAGSLACYYKTASGGLSSGTIDCPRSSLPEFPLKKWVRIDCFYRVRIYGSGLRCPETNQAVIMLPQWVLPPQTA